MGRKRPREPEAKRAFENIPRGKTKPEVGDRVEYRFNVNTDEGESHGEWFPGEIRGKCGKSAACSDGKYKGISPIIHVVF